MKKKMTTPKKYLSGPLTDPLHQITLLNMMWQKKWQTQTELFHRTSNGEVPFVPRFICTKTKNRSHLYQNYSTRFLIGRIVSQQIITLIFYCSNRRKLNSRLVTAAVSPTCCELANIG